MCSMYIVQLIWYKLQLKTLKHSGSVEMVESIYKSNVSIPRACIMRHLLILQNNTLILQILTLGANLT